MDYIFHNVIFISNLFSLADASMQTMQRANLFLQVEIFTDHIQWYLVLCKHIVNSSIQTFP